MTAFDLVEQYRKRNGQLPPEGQEWLEISILAEHEGVQVMPDEDSIIAVVQMMRQREQEIAGQGRLL